MWNKAKHSTPPQNEILQVFAAGGIELFAVYEDGNWYQPDKSRLIKSTITHWKRMGQ